MNQADGRIFGEVDGIATLGVNSLLTTIDNRGSIFGQSAGIVVQLGNSLIINSGTVESGYAQTAGLNAAVFLALPLGATATLINSGRIVTDLAGKIASPFFVLRAR